MNSPRLPRLFSLILLSLPLGCAHRVNPPPLAQIDGHVLPESEFALYIQALSPVLQEAVKQDSVERRKAFEEYLRQRLSALAAQESGHPALDSLRRRLTSLDQAVITQFYQLVFIGENLGITRREIEAFYKGNPERFRDSAGRLPPIGEILERVSDTMVLSRADLDSFHRANAANYPPPQPELRRKLAENYLLELKQKRSENAAAELKAKYGAHLLPFFRPPTDAEIAGYYAQNKEAYESPEAFDLYHIETSSPDALGAKVAAAKDLEAFKGLAMRISENAWTKPLGGRLGPVKRNFCLPYGIGMMPYLFPVLDTVQSGKITDPVQNPETGKWHYFWLAGKLPRSLKPLDRVKSLVAQDFLTNRIPVFKPEDTVAVVPGRRAILERDVVFLRGEYPQQIRSLHTRENLADFLMEREVIVAEAESLGILEDERLKALRLENELTFWTRFYLDSILSPSWNQDTAALASLFARKPQVFAWDSAQRDWRSFSRDLAAYSLLTSEDLEIEYQVNRERYLRGDSLPPFTEVEGEVFHSLKGEAYRRLDARAASALKERFQVRIHPSLQEPTYEPADKFLKQAEAFHRDRMPDRALFLYGRLREKFPGNDALQNAVGLGMAQIHLEQKRFQQALAEYRRVGLLYPRDPDHYKALFMEGFILAEHFKRDSAAVRAFERMLAKYPNSELSKEADWMIRNIRSGGALMSEPQGGN